MRNINLLLTAIIILLLGSVGLYWFMNNPDLGNQYNKTNTDNGLNTEEVLPVELDGGIGDGAGPLEEQIPDGEPHVIGQSAGGSDIIAYHFGSGSKEVLLIGGIHGGFAPGTVTVMENYVDSLKKENSLPSDLRLTIIPLLNPDSLNKGTGLAGRLNNNNVDLNRNFGCNWKEEGVWRQQSVSGGKEAFSEPEAKALRNYIDNNRPTAVVAYYAASGGVYVSACDGIVNEEASNLVDVYANASGYKANKTFDSYVTNGDLTNWLAKENIPAISVLLTNYTNPELAKNLKGIEAVLMEIAK